MSVAPAPDSTATNGTATNGAAPTNGAAAATPPQKPAPPKSVSPTPTDASNTPLVNENQDVENPVGLEIWADHKEPPCWDVTMWNKGDYSNVATAVVLIIGLVMRTSLGARNASAGFILAFGLFGFAGGITNWLAVKMLFDRIPGLVGSGVIPNRFREIRGALKDTIMRSFFDEHHLQRYIDTKGPEMMEKCNLA